MSASHGVNPALSLFLHHRYACLAFPVWRGHRTQRLLCMIDFLVGDGCLRTPWQRDIHAKVVAHCVICIASLAILPIEGYDQIEAFGWLEHPTGCDE